MVLNMYIYVNALLLLYLLLWWVVTEYRFIATCSYYNGSYRNGSYVGVEGSRATHQESGRTKSICCHLSEHHYYYSYPHRNSRIVIATIANLPVSAIPIFLGFHRYGVLLFLKIIDDWVSLSTTASKRRIITESRKFSLKVMSNAFQ